MSQEAGMSCSSPQGGESPQRRSFRQRRHHHCHHQYWVKVTAIGVMLVIALASMSSKFRLMSEYQSDYVASFASSWTVPAAAEEEERSTCAILLFGLPRHFNSLVLPSLKLRVFSPNPDCDVYVHSYNVTSVTNIRNGELGAVARPQELYSLLRLNDDHYYGGRQRHVEIALEDMDSFYRLRNDTMSHYREEHWPYKKWQGDLMYPFAMENMIKQWHSIHSVWDMMHRHEIRIDRPYDTVGLLRNDVYYGTDIFLHGGGWGDAVVPAFSPFPVNDRMFVGKRPLAEIWATTRFSGAHSYLETTADGSNKRPDGLHSETFMMEYIFPNITRQGNGTTYLDVRKDICFFRVRGTGVILTSDCWCASTKKNGKLPCPPSATTNWTTILRNETGFDCVPFQDNGVSQTKCLIP